MLVVMVVLLEVVMPGVVVVVAVVVVVEAILVVLMVVVADLGVRYTNNQYNKQNFRYHPCKIINMEKIPSIQAERKGY
jgi:hypothetical protein